MWKIIVELDNLQVTIWLLRIACWITHSKYVIVITFSLRQYLHERASILYYTYIACILMFTAIRNPSDIYMYIYIYIYIYI